MERKVNWWFFVGMFVVALIFSTLTGVVLDQSGLNEPYRRLVVVLVAFTVLPAYSYIFYREKFGWPFFALWVVAILTFGFLSVLDESTLSGTYRTLLMVLALFLLLGGFYLVRRFRR
jgi:hypothetical protein